ncbi:MAG: ATP-binding protein [Anaerolineae bacterium]|jgi:PAS domain S-box-containing protein
MRLDKPSKSPEQIEHLESEVRELYFLHETTRLLTATLDLDSVLGSLMAQVRDYFDVEAVSVALLDGESGQLTFRVAVGEAAEAVVGLRIPVDKGIAGWVIREGEAVLITDAYSDSRFYPRVDEQTAFRTETLLAVPIMTDHEPIGVIEAINPSAGTFDDNAPRLLARVADQAALAIRNAELYERARQAERRYESLFQRNPAPILVLGLDCEVLDLNQEAADLLEHPMEELIGGFWWDLIGEPAAACEATFDEVRESRQVTVQTKLWSHGSLRVIEAHMTAIDYGGREAIQWIGNDITEQLELERMQDDLIHMIVHDLRNPLSNVVGSLQMMRTALTQGDDSLPLMEVLGVAMRSSQRLRRLIDSLLDLRQLQEGKADLDKVMVAPRLLAQEALQSVRPIVAKKEQKLTAEIPPNLPSVEVDRDMLIRVLTNLLDNAAKFTPTEGEIALTLEKAPQMVLFKVSDTGPGVPPESKERIFERFTRLESTKRTRGTGLGLPFCKLAVEAHGGEIWVDSTPGEGSHFTISVPIETDDQATLLH